MNLVINMIVEKINPQGFCKGVILALRKCVEVINNPNTKKPIYLLGMIIHNRYVCDELKEKGLWFYAADMDGESLYKTDLRGAVGIVLGSEGDGISRLVREKCDFIVSIPMYGNVNSMNVSCAAAVILSEVANQKNRGEV